MYVSVTDNCCANVLVINQSINQSIYLAIMWKEYVGASPQL